MVLTVRQAAIPRIHVALNPDASFWDEAARIHEVMILFMIAFVDIAGSLSWEILFKTHVITLRMSAVYSVCNGNRASSWECCSAACQRFHCIPNTV